MSEAQVIKQAVAWTARASRAISDAGGCPEALLSKFPAELIEALVRNNIHLTHTKRRDV